MKTGRIRPILSVALLQEIAGAHGEAKAAYNLWLGGVDSVSVPLSEETERLRAKAQQETGEDKEIAHAEKTKNKSSGSAAVAENLHGLFSLAKTGMREIDISAIIARSLGDEILAAKACRQCVNAAMSGIPLESYAKMHRELAVAISREKK